MVIHLCQLRSPAEFVKVRRLLLNMSDTIVLISSTSLTRTSIFNSEVRSFGVRSVSSNSRVLSIVQAIERWHLVDAHVFKKKYEA
jgi:hypothetical protein